MDEQRHKWACFFFNGLEPTVPEGMATELDQDLKSFYPIDSLQRCPQLSDPG